MSSGWPDGGKNVLVFLFFVAVGVRRLVARTWCSCGVLGVLEYRNPNHKV